MIAERPSLVTVGIACYDADDTIGRALDSALAQDWPRLEVVVVDDGSVDHSRDVVARYAREDTRIRLVRHGVNRGPGAARQTILDEARGDFIAFFDDDDESASRRLTVQYKRIVEYEHETGCSLVACYASGSRIYPNGYELDVKAIGSRPFVPKGTELADFLLFNGRRPGVFYGGGTPTCALMARKETLLAAGGFDPGMRRVEDADLAVRLAMMDAHFIGCRERLYTQYATRGADKTAQKNYQAEMALIEKYRAYLEEKRRYRYARDWFTMRYYHFNGQPLRMAVALLGLWVRHPRVVTKHALTTIPARFRHERQMQRGM